MKLVGWFRVTYCRLRTRKRITMARQSLYIIQDDANRQYSEHKSPINFVYIISLLFSIHIQQKNNNKLMKIYSARSDLSTNSRPYLNILCNYPLYRESWTCFPSNIVLLGKISMYCTRSAFSFELFFIACLRMCIIRKT